MSTPTEPLAGSPGVAPTDLTEAPAGPIAPERLWTLFAYLPGTGSASAWADLLAPLPLGFTPTRGTIKVIGEDSPTVPYDDGFLDRLRTTDDVSSFELEDVEREGADDQHVRASLVVTVAGTRVEVLLAGVEPDPSWLSALAAAPGLVGGERGDQVDAMWQGETAPQHFGFWYPGPWEHLPRTTDKRGREQMDVSGNPGRITEVAGWRMWATQDDWFGPGARLYLDLDALASLPVGTLTELGHDRWHLRLWPDGASLEDIRSAQRALREHLGYDEATSRDDEIFQTISAALPDDPMFVAEEGRFDHGGVTRVLQYFSAAKRPTTRSRAAWVEVLEFDADHHEVYAEVVDLSTQPHPG